MSLLIVAAAFVARPLYGVGADEAAGDPPAGPRMGAELAQLEIDRRVGLLDDDTYDEAVGALDLRASPSPAGRPKEAAEPPSPD